MPLGYTADVCQKKKKKIIPSLLTAVLTTDHGENGLWAAGNFDKIAGKAELLLWWPGAALLISKC